VAGFISYRNIRSSNAVPAASNVGSALPLKLSVAEKQNQLEVTWDRNTPAIASANRGVLSISDGSSRRDIELSGTQLRNGRVLYSRLSGDVNLHMEVFPEGRSSVSESIRIVSIDEPKPLEPPPPVAPATANHSAKKKAQRPAAKISSGPASRAPSDPVSSSPAPERAPNPPAPAPPAAPPEVELQRPAVRR
jgi:hypothetical protein